MFPLWEAGHSGVFSGVLGVVCLREDARVTGWAYDHPSQEGGRSLHPKLPHTGSLVLSGEGPHLLMGESRLHPTPKLFLQACL